MKSDIILYSMLFNFGKSLKSSLNLMMSIIWRFHMNFITLLVIEVRVSFEELDKSSPDFSNLSSWRVLNSNFKADVVCCNSVLKKIK